MAALVRRAIEDHLRDCDGPPPRECVRALALLWSAHDELERAATLRPGRRDAGLDHAPA